MNGNPTAEIADAVATELAETPKVPYRLKQVPDFFGFGDRVFSAMQVGPYIVHVIFTPRYNGGTIHYHRKATTPK